MPLLVFWNNLLKLYLDSFTLPSGSTVYPFKFSVLTVKRSLAESKVCRDNSGIVQNSYLNCVIKMFNTLLFMVLVGVLKTSLKIS